MRHPTVATSWKERLFRYWIKVTYVRMTTFPAILDWLRLLKVDKFVTICHDSKFDRTIFLRIFGRYLPVFIRLRPIGSRHFNEFLRDGFHVVGRLSEHHALHDATAMRHAFREPQLFNP